MTRSLKRTLIAVGIVWLAAMAVGGYRLAQWQQKRELIKGIELFEANQLKEANIHLKRAKMWGPRAWDVREQLGLVLLRSGRFEEALNEFKDAAQLSPKQALLYLDQGFCLAHLKRYQEAREAFLRAAEVDSKNVMAFWLAASMSEKLGDKDAAEIYLRKVLVLEPKNKEAAERLALLTGGGKANEAP